MVSLCRSSWRHVLVFTCKNRLQYSRERARKKSKKLVKQIAKFANSANFVNNPRCISQLTKINVKKMRNLLILLMILDAAQRTCSAAVSLPSVPTSCAAAFAKSWLDMLPR